MGRTLSLYARTRIVNLKINKRNIKIAQIRRHLSNEDGIKVTWQAIFNFWKRYVKTGMLTDDHKGIKKPVLNIEHFDFVDKKMEANSELSAQELRDLINHRFGLDVSRRTVQRVRSKLGWEYSRRLVTAS